MSKPCPAARVLAGVPAVAMALAAICLAASAPAGDDWKPAANPLMTKWGRQVRPDQAWPEYPRPQLVRADWRNLNGLWDFAVTGKEAARPATFDRKILVPFCPDSALSGLRIKIEPGDRLWYRREFSIPREWKGQRVIAHFGGVDWDTTILVNGQETGRHRGSYMAFSCDITAALRADGQQELVLSVWNPCGAAGEPKGKQSHAAHTLPGGIMYTRTSGIWQTVWLEPVPQTYIASLRITPDVDGNLLKLTVQAGGQPGAGVVRAQVKDGGRTVAKASGKPGEEITLKIAQPKLWSPDEPNLYDLNVSLQAGGSKDAVTSYCALRKISIGKDAQGITRMLLNGKFVMQVGPLDQGFWPDGLYTPPSEDALKFDIAMMKKYGFNMARKHVKVEPDRWYYWCDKLGLLVWQDMPSAENNSPEARKQFETELAEMIAGLYNHPSIIMWIPFNEGWGQYDTPRITALTKQLDPSRLVNNASGWTDAKVGDILDQHTYPVPAAPRPEENRAAVIGEFGGLGYNVPGNRWHDSGWGYATYNGLEALNTAYLELYKTLFQGVKDPGISGAVYTQLTDIEAENNGLMSYDREIFKIDPAYASIHKGEIPRGYLSPQFADFPDIFMDEAILTLKDPPKDAKVYYTLDGSAPSPKSMEYKDAIVIKQDATLKIVAVWPDGVKSPVHSAAIKRAQPVPAATPGDTTPGLAAAYYELENTPAKLPDFAALKPARTVPLDKFTIEFERRGSNFGVVYQGFIKVPKAGVYTFGLDSDDGTKLFIGARLVVENDGVHGMKEARGSIALAAGFHPITVQYFQGINGLGLDVYYQGPGISRMAIPKDALSCESKK